jgi:hypothetical protein
MTRALRPVASLLAAVLLLGACGEQAPAEPTETAGSLEHPLQVLVDEGALDALATDIHQFVSLRPAGVSWGGGTAEAIATTVKHGYRISVVVLPSGPALDRIRDELLSPPTRLGRLRGVTYWVCTVDKSGQTFVRYLTGRVSQRVLRSQGFTSLPRPDRPAGSAGRSYQRAPG